MNLDYLMNVVAGLRDRLDAMPLFRWATVVGTRPLRVQLDGDETPLSADPVNLAGDLARGARVWTVSVNRRLHILGAPGGSLSPAPQPQPQPQPVDPPSLSLQSVPAGMIMAYAGVNVPDGWLMCDGTSYRKGDYPALAAALGATGTGGEFMVPDLRGRFLMGVSDAHPLASSGGEEAHVLTVEEMPAHSHPMVGWGAWETGAGIWGSNVGAGNGWTILSSYQEGALGRLEAAPAGGGKAHNNLPPFYAVGYIIKA